MSDQSSEVTIIMHPRIQGLYPFGNSKFECKIRTATVRYQNVRLELTYMMDLVGWSLYRVEINQPSGQEVWERKNGFLDPKIYELEYLFSADLFIQSLL